MDLTTHEKIRKEVGFQSHFVREAFKNSPDGSDSVFFVQTDDNHKIVPEFLTGATTAGISDVKVYVGLSGIDGISQMTVTSIDDVAGSITLDTPPSTGASVVVTYSSSSVSNEDIGIIKREVQTIINQRLSLCYSTPLTTVPSSITRMASRLAGAFLLIRNYGTGSRNASADGYALYEQIMGSNEQMLGRGDDNDISIVGELNMICTGNFNLVDDSGNIIDRTDESAIGAVKFTSGGRTGGRVYDITEEQFRRKDFQSEVDKNQPGSGNTYSQ